MEDSEKIDKENIFVKPPIIKTPKNSIEIPKNEDGSEEIEITPENIEEFLIKPINEPSLEIVPTAHISDKSVDMVREIIHEKKPEIVAIELDTQRYQRLIEESKGIKHEEKFDLKSLLKSSNLTVTIVSMLLSHMQKKMGSEVGVSPGSEMLEAVKIANEVNADIALIDRNIQITLKRTINGMKFIEKLTFGWGILKTLFMGDDETTEEELKQEIENLKEENAIEEAMNLFKEASPGGYNALVHERDAYMAHHLKSLEDKNVVAVVGAGHKNGMLEYLNNPDTIPSLDSISYVKESRISFSKFVLYLIPILFVVIFIIAFFQGINIEGGIINYLIFAGGGAFIGSLLSGSKIQSAIVGLLVAPITVLHPLLAAGWFSGLVEGKLRHVGFSDLEEITEVDSFKELWHNKLFRVILVVIGTNLGCSIGFLLTITNVIFPYLHGIFGF